MSSIDKALAHFNKGLKKLEAAIACETRIQEGARKNKEFYESEESRAAAEVERGKRVQERLKDLLS